jgi:hypothetical protein
MTEMNLKRDVDSRQAIDFDADKAVNELVGQNFK